MIRDFDCHASQRALLLASVERVQGTLLAQPIANPMSLTALIAAAWNRRADEQVVEVGAFSFFYFASLDLFDDVQDEDLAGKPHADAGPPIAINSALTLLFLALQALRRAIELESDCATQREYLKLFNRVSLSAVVGQHVDLLGEEGVFAPDAVLDLLQVKTSSMALVAECGALLAHCGDENRARYREVGERLSQVVQIVDDLRDIFGKDVSPDLATHKCTYPVACFLDEASPSDEARFRELVAELPGSLHPIRELLFEAGVVERCAVTLERLRREIHGAVVATGNSGAYHRLLLGVVDGLVSSVYEPDAIASSARFFVPRGGWHDRVKEELERFAARMAPHGLPGVPRLIPWHLPHYMYMPDGDVIHYPDLEELRDEILPFQAELLGSTDLDEVASIMAQQLPAVLAHEMFHYWRSAAHRLTADHWHEEYAANRLAMGYAQRYCPEALESALRLAEQVSRRFPEALDDKARRALERCSRYHSDSGYEMSMMQTAIVELEMVRELAASPLDFDEDRRVLLCERPVAGAGDTARL